MTARRIVFVAIAVLVGAYYLWQARAGNGPFDFGHDLDGYYDLLARGFLHGHTYVPVEPSPQLLALPDPYDPKVNEPFRYQDMVLYRGHYYLYFGAAPAVLLFAPWRIVTHHDLPQNFGIVLLAFGGFLFFCGALLRIFDLSGIRPRPVFLAFLLLAVGVCSPIPYLLNRAAVYEVAIAGGYFCISAAVFFLARGWMAASGLFFAAAVAGRPDLVFAGLIALLALAIFQWRTQRRAVLVFAAALAAGGCAIATYNYERFDNPLEFGFRYQLAGPGQNRIELGTRNIVPSGYYMLLSRPEIEPVFPWMRMVFRFPFDSAEKHPLPPEYFVEPTVGALWTTPFLLAAFWIRGKALSRMILAAAAAGGAAILMFLICTHLASHRYEADFVPLLVFAAIANLALARSRTVAAIACVLIGYSAAANLALGLAGPYDDYLKAHPQGYVRLASHFSPRREYRPLWNPHIQLRFTVRFDGGYHEPLVTIGRSHYCYFLYAEFSPGTVVLVSKTNESEQKIPIPVAETSPLLVDLQYAPQTGDVTVSAGQHPPMVHHVGPLVAAPATVAIGENYADMGLTARKFGGKIEVLQKNVN